MCLTANRRVAFINAHPSRCGGTTPGVLSVLHIFMANDKKSNRQHHVTTRIRFFICKSPNYVKNVILQYLTRCKLHGCGVGVARSRSRIFCPAPEVQLNHFFAAYSWVRNPNSRLLKWYNFCWNFFETDNFYCITRFPLITSYYKIVDSKTSLMLC